MKRSRATSALLPAALACLLAAVPALADEPAQGGAEPPRLERPEWTDHVRDAAVSLWNRLLLVITPDDGATKGDRTPGSGLDPDGHKPPPVK